MKNIKSEFEKQFSGTDSNGNKTVTTLNYTFVNSVKRKKDFFIEFTDKVKGGGKSAVGKVDEVGDTQQNRIQVSSGLNNSNTTETAIHELGHTAGLRHETDSQNPSVVKNSMGTNNTMNASGFGNNQITAEQLTEVAKNTPTTTVIKPKDLPAMINIPRTVIKPINK